MESWTCSSHLTGECMKRQTKEILLKKGFKTEKKFPRKGIGYKVYWKDLIDAFRFQILNVRRDKFYKNILIVLQFAVTLSTQNWV